MTQEIKELANKLSWYIENRWTDEEHQGDAKQVVDKLIKTLDNEAPNLVEPEEVDNPKIDDESLDSFSVPKWLVSSEEFPIVGKRFTKEQFIKYVQWVKENETYSWEPSGITMHHTAYPDLSMRPNGFTEQHMKNICHGYMNDRGWKRGPHIFTDDKGIWVFNPLSKRGIHAISYNSSRYGIEMLDNFDKSDDFDNQRGKLSLANGQFAAAVLMKYADISTAKLNFHRHDPETSKRCPGKQIAFSSFEEEVLDLVETI